MTQFFDLMIDTETAGMPPTGALMSIGAVFFDLPTQTVGPTFNRTIHLASSVKHGGTIDFESELGKGTTFVVRVPFGARDTTGDAPEVLA